MARINKRVVTSDDDSEEESHPTPSRNKKTRPNSNSLQEEKRVRKPSQAQQQIGDLQHYICISIQLIAL